MRYRVALTLVLTTLTLGAVAIAAKWSDATSTTRPFTRLADTLPSLDLQDPRGQTISLRSRTSGHFTLLYVVNQAECASCANFAEEFRIIRRQTPRIEPLLIASGAPPAQFASLLSQMQVTEQALVDQHRALLAWLHLSSEPAAVLVDSSGRVLFVDVRSTSRAAQFPMSRLLHDLGGAAEGANDAR